MFEKFTEKAIKVVMLSQEEARRLGHNFVGTEQLLLGLLAERDSLACDILRQAGINLRKARNEVERLVGRGAGFVAVEIPFTPRAKRVLENAIEASRMLGHGYIGTEHILVGLLGEDVGVGARVLEHQGLDVLKLREKVVRILAQDPDSPVPIERSYAGYDYPEGDPESFESFTTNLTETAYYEGLDPVIGRDSEIQRVIEILARRRKNNPVLIGEPGVGKTAVAEGLAQLIVDREAPDMLLDMQVVSLDIGLLLAGTKYRGEFEERLKCIIDEVKTYGDLIIVIDELHTLVGAGASEGAVDAANILKPALARGELQCIGATTVDEYRKYIEKDAALERRFQPVHINEPSVEDTIKILMGLRERYEEHHCLEITYEAIQAAASMGSQYIADRFLPDKAIDLIDQAGSRVRLRSRAMPNDFNAAVELLNIILYSKELAIIDQEYIKAEVARSRELDLYTVLDALVVKYKIPKGQDETLYNSRLLEEDVAGVVASWTGIPVVKLSTSEAEKLLAMEEILHSRVIGQSMAVESIARAIRRARVGLRNPNRPIASFLFSGPTGVGKTELTKALAYFFFGSEASMVRLDMSEYMERHTVSKLIGSPPGYVGYEEGGQLTEAVRRKPYTVILFDEIEKAHPDVFNLLLQVLEDGRLTDSKGRTVDFKNSMIILTSNIGAKVVEKTLMADAENQSVGFGNPLGGKDLTYEKMAEGVQEELKRFFRPEFLNRLDDIIVFQQLTKTDLVQIADIMLAELISRASEKNFILTISEPAKNFLIDEGFNPIYGARPLRRAITRLLEDKLSTLILSTVIEPGSTVAVDLDDSRTLTTTVIDPNDIPQNQEVELLDESMSPEDLEYLKIEKEYLIEQKALIQGLKEKHFSEADQANPDTEFEAEISRDE
jgi:ATP-dependent Clp protease ATP-binding subunit ClpC